MGRSGGKCFYVSYLLAGDGTNSMKTISSKGLVAAAASGMLLTHILSCSGPQDNRANNRSTTTECVEAFQLSLLKGGRLGISDGQRMPICSRPTMTLVLTNLTGHPVEVVPPDCLDYIGITIDGKNSDEEWIPPSLVSEIAVPLAPGESIRAQVDPRIGTSSWVAFPDGLYHASLQWNPTLGQSRENGIPFDFLFVSLSEEADVEGARQQEVSYCELYGAL